MFVQNKFYCRQYGKVQEIESFKISRKFALYTTSSLAIENMVVLSEFRHWWAPNTPPLYLKLVSDIFAFLTLVR